MIVIVISVLILWINYIYDLLKINQHDINS